MTVWKDGGNQMAKFRQGNLVLTSDQEIIQGSETILGANGVANFSSLKLVSGLTVNDISNDSTSNNTNQLLTAEAIHDLNIAGTSGTSGTSGATGASGTSGTSGTSGLGNLQSGIDNNIAIYDGTSSIQASLLNVSDGGDLTGVSSLTITGTGILQSGSTPSGTLDLE